MNPKRKFTIESPRALGGQLGVNQRVVDFAEFRRGLPDKIGARLKSPRGQQRCATHRQDCLGTPQGIPRPLHALDRRGAEADKFQATQRVMPVKA